MRIARLAIVLVTILGVVERIVMPALATEPAVLVKDITPGASSTSLSLFTCMDGKLYFKVPGGLWRSDGTDTGTFRVKPISIEPAYWYPTWLTNVNGTLFFGGREEGSSTGTELWKSDGTTAGTVLVRLIHRGWIARFDRACAGIR